MAARTIRSSIDIQPEASQGLLQLLIESGMGQVSRPRLGYHADVGNPGQTRLVAAEIFAQPALEAIPADGVANLAADGGAQPRAGRVRHGRFGGDDRQVPGVTAFTIAPEAGIFP